MPKKMEFSRGVDDSTGAEKKKPKIVYSTEVRQKLDDVLAIAKKAETDAERIIALGEYKKEIESVAEGQKERMKLVDFHGEKIHNFELQALNKIVEQINEDYAEQRRRDKDFKAESIEIDQIEVKIENEKVVSIRLNEKMLTKIPTAVGELTNLQSLWINGNQITEISGLDNLINLQTLGIGENQITEISGLDNLINLQSLEINRNRITKISGLNNLTKLRNLWLGGNEINTTDEKIKEQIKALKDRRVNVLV